MSERVIPQTVKVADKATFLKKHKLRAVKFWWHGNEFVMGVVETAPEKGGDDRR